MLSENEIQNYLEILNNYNDVQFDENDEYNHELEKTENYLLVCNKCGVRIPRLHVESEYQDFSNHQHRKISVYIRKYYLEKQTK